MGSLRKNWRDFRKELEKFVEKYCNKIHPSANRAGRSAEGRVPVREKAGLPRYSGTVEVGVALEAVEAVEHEDLVIAVVRDELVEAVVVVAEVHHVDVGIVGRQVGHEAVGVAVLDDQNSTAPGAVALDAAQTVVAVEKHGVLVVDGKLVRVVEAGGLALGGLARGSDGVDGQGVGQVVVGDGVRLGVGRPGLGVVGAVEALCRPGCMG